MYPKPSGMVMKIPQFIISIQPLTQNFELNHYDQEHLINPSYINMNHISYLPQLKMTRFDVDVFQPTPRTMPCLKLMYLLHDFLKLIHN